MGQGRTQSTKNKEQKAESRRRRFGSDLTETLPPALVPLSYAFRLLISAFCSPTLAPSFLYPSACDPQPARSTSVVMEHRETSRIGEDDGPRPDLDPTAASR